MNLIQLQPDDVLVVSHPSYLSQEQREAMAGILRQALGSSQRVLIIDAGQTLDVLRGVALQQAQDEQSSVPAQTGTLGRQEQHVDIDEPEADGTPPHVWLYRNMLTEQQAVAPLGRDETNGQYAVAIDQLTPEQLQIRHIDMQLTALAASKLDRVTEENEILKREVQ